jgi:hypothetical protein
MCGGCAHDRPSAQARGSGTAAPGVADPAIDRADACEQIHVILTRS